MSSLKTVSGKCLCGSVAVKFSLANNTFAACHCGMCRKWSGGPALAVEGKSVAFQGEESIGVYESSSWAERGFCKNCGTHIFYRLKSGDYINFPLGLLEDVDQLKFDLQIFIDKKPENYSFSNKTELMTEAEVFAKFKS